MTTVGLLHPGEMGAAVGAALLDAGAHEVLWASAGRSPATARRARQAGLVDVEVAAELMRRSEVILSVCPPHAAMSVARSLEGFDGLYVDANAVAPETARSIGTVHERFVDGGIIGPPPGSEETTRLYLSGDAASEVASLFDGTRLEARVVSEEIGAASAVKMAFAGWTKGSSALLLAVRALARAEGVEAWLLDEWSAGELPRRSESAARSALGKGWRWAGEMEEIARSFACAGLPDGFHLAAAELYRRSAATADGGEDELDRVLAALAGTAAGRAGTPPGVSSTARR